MSARIVKQYEEGVLTLFELKDIQLPDDMKRAMARQAEAGREKRAKIINAEGKSLAAAALGRAQRASAWPTVIA